MMMVHMMSPNTMIHSTRLESLYGNSEVYVKNVIFGLSVLFFFGISGHAVAGPGHEDGHSHSQGPISKNEVIKRATEKVINLAGKGKIDESWDKVKASSVEQKSYAKGPEWLIIFNNEKIMDPKKQTLYLFYTLDGHYIAANYTGN